MTMRTGTQNLQRTLFNVLPYAVLLFAVVQFWTITGVNGVGPVDGHALDKNIHSGHLDRHNDKTDQVDNLDKKIISQTSAEVADEVEGASVTGTVVPDAVRVVAAIAGVAGSSAMGGACCGCCLQKGKQGAGCCNWCCKCCDATLDTCCPCCDDKCCHNCCKPCAKQCKCCKGCCIGCPECCGCDPDCGCCRRCRACCPCCCEKHEPHCEPHCEEPPKKKCAPHPAPHCNGGKDQHYDDECGHGDHYMPHNYIM